MADNYLERHRRDYEQRKQQMLKRNTKSRIQLYKEQYEDH